MNRVILIGDLHGCLFEAEELLDKCKATPNDHVVFLGDLVDRGPDSAGCVDLAMRIEARQGKPACILGNHEEKALSYNEQAKRTGKEPNIQAPTHLATRQQLRSEHYTYMQSLPLFLRIPEHNAVAVHAGVYPGRPIEAQEAQHLLHIQMIKPYDKWGNPTHNMKSMWPSRVPDNEKGWTFWSTVWPGPERIIFGHSVLDKPLLTDKVCGIDGGCCFGEELRAVILPDWQIVSVPSQTKYLSRRNAATGNNVMLYNVHGDVNTYS